MKLETHADGSLAIRESFRFLRIASVVCASVAVLAFLLLAREWQEAGEMQWAALGVAVLCLAGMVVDDRSFLFNAATKRLSWERSNLFRCRRGELLFSDIRDALVVREKSRNSDHKVGGYDVRYGAMLVTSTGNIALGSRYGNSEEEYRELIARVLEVLGMPGKSPRSDDEVRRLIAAGRTIDAVSLMQERDGLDLNAAHAAVRRIQQQSGSQD